MARADRSYLHLQVTGHRRLQVTKLNVAGDEQSDLSVHAGIDKAVYVYPSEHYEYWRGEYPQMELPWGMFGENLSIQGLLEQNVRIGDRLRVGSAEFVVTQPRMPCFKLGIRFGRPDMVKRFLESRRSGFYLAVSREGEVAAGDAIEVTERHHAAISIPELLGMYLKEAAPAERLREAVAIPALSDAWREELQRRLPDQL